jgi:hypothetical protein
LVVTGVALASVAGVVLAQSPAMADPTVTYVAVGSDTIQDVMNAFASSEGGNLLGSYNATNPATQGIHEVITPAKAGVTTSTNAIAPESCSFNRPDGSGEGATALRASLAGTSSAGGHASTAAAIGGEAISISSATGNLPSNLPGQNCVDIARSSSTPATGSVDANGGYLLYVPFALDAVTAGVGPSSAIAPTTANSLNLNLPVGCTVGGSNPCATIPKSNLSALAGVGFSLASLTAMYNSGDDGIANGATSPGTCYAPFGGGAPDLAPAGFTCSSTVFVDLYIPQPGSGTLSFWASETGKWNSASPPAWDYQTIQPDLGPTGTPETLPQFYTATQHSGGLAANPVQVEEHDGTAVSVDPNGISPQSIAQFVAQNNGHDPRFHGLQLTPVSGVAPTTSGALNTAFPVTRDVFNVVAYDRVVNTGDGNYDSTLAQLLVTSSSTGTAVLCNDKLLIEQYGFGLLTSAPLNGLTCGDVNTTLDRAYDTTTSAAF